MLTSSFNNNNSSSNAPSPIQYADNILSYIINDSDPNSKQHDQDFTIPTCFYHLPSPFIYNEIDDFVCNDNDLESIQRLSFNNNNDDSPILGEVDDHQNDNNMVLDESNKSSDEMNGIVENNGTSPNNKKGGGSLVNKRKRASNKDRHSKIKTANGLRDRRMRLSLQVARPFFNLQDMLGFDKASRTVEWLLLHSHSAIEELTLTKHGSLSDVTKCTISSTSEDGEVESSTIIGEEFITRNSSSKHNNKGSKKNEPKNKRKIPTKEERGMARERARKRTSEKLKTKDHDPTRSWNNNSTSTLSYHQQTFEVSQTVPSYGYMI